MSSGREISASPEKAEAILREYISSTSLDPDTGVLNFSGLPIIFARANILSSIYSGLEGLMGESAAGVLRSVGRAYGQGFHELLASGPHADLLAPDNREKLLEFVCAETQAIGWGRITITEDAGQIIITSPEGLAAGRNYPARGQHPVDAYFVGYFEGFFGTLDGVEYHGRETDCVAAGGPVCRIVLSREIVY